MEYLFVLSRLVFGGYFLYNAYNHAMNNAGMVGYAKSRGLPMAELATPVAGVLLFLGGAGILLGVMIPWAVLALVVFLVTSAFGIHSFWKDTDMNMKMGNQVNFGKNLALAGSALAYLFVPASVWMWTLM